MNLVDSIQNTQRKEKLINTYLSEPQIGLFLGAGVTAASNVPTFEELALRMLEHASEKGILPLSKEWVSQFVQCQRCHLMKGLEIVPPQQIALYIQSVIEAGYTEKYQLDTLIYDALYQVLNKRHLLHPTSVNPKIFIENTTLNAILTFCAARGSSVVAHMPYLTTPRKEKRTFVTNGKVGAILTTNFDNLVEGTFHSKYRKNKKYPLLKPVGRPAVEINEIPGSRQVIHVYHIHGYVHYDASTRTETDAVITERDYFRVFFNPDSFGNSVAIAFFRRFPCLFIGASMKDQNIRRFLLQIKNIVPNQPKFALLQTEDQQEDELTDYILQSVYGVEAIWMRDFAEIGRILHQMYDAVPGIECEVEWDYLWRYAREENLIPPMSQNKS